MSIIIFYVIFIVIFQKKVPRRPKSTPTSNAFAFEIPTPLQPQKLNNFGERPLPWSFNT